VEEPQQEAEAHLNKACEVFFPDLTAWIVTTQAQAAAEQEEKKQQQQQQKEEEESVPPLALGNVVKDALHAPAGGAGGAAREAAGGAAGGAARGAAAAAAGAAVAEEAVEMLNLLGLLWSGREDMARARLYLLAAKEAYSMLEHFCPVPSSSGSAAAAGGGGSGGGGGGGTGDEKKEKKKEEEVTSSSSSSSSTAAGESSSSSSSPHPTFRRLIDGHHTHTLYYLAQVYGQLRDADASASYCHQTLAKQLEWEEERLDAWGWVSNCMSLVDYLVGGRGDREAAARCLEACSALLKREEKEEGLGGREDEEGREKRAFVRADVHRRWAALYSSILQEAAEFMEEEGEGGREDEGEMEGDAPVAFVVQFPSLQTTATAVAAAAAALPKPRDIKTFAKARPVFLLAQKHLDAALGFFQLDGHVTDYVHLTRAVSRLYRDLSVFETDDKRRQAMFLRRATALQPLLDQLNPRAYVGLLKMLSFELGEVYLTLLEMKSARIELKLGGGGGREGGRGGYVPSKAEGEKCDEYCRLAIAAFERFVGLYQKEAEGGREGGREGGIVWDLPGKEDFGPVFRALFHLARLYGRMCVYGGGGEEAHRGRVEGNKKSLAAYEWLRRFGVEQVERLWGGEGGGREGGRGVYAEELATCEEMIRMLPEKIARMHYQKTTI